MKRYLPDLITIAAVTIFVAALILFFPGQKTGENAVTDAKLPAPQTSPAPALPVPTPPAVTDAELAAPQTSPEPAQPVPTPPAATDAELAAPQTSPEPAQPVPTPPAATSPAPGKEPSTSTALATPSPQNLATMAVRVQEALMLQGYYKGAIDGIPGPQTRAAITKYQKAQGLPQTGQMDTQTLARLGVSIP